MALLQDVPRGVDLAGTWRYKTTPHTPPARRPVRKPREHLASRTEPCAGGQKLSSRRAVNVCSALTSARISQVSRFCAGSAPNATRPDTYNSQMAVQIRDKEKRAAENQLRDTWELGKWLKLFISERKGRFCPQSGFNPSLNPSEEIGAIRGSLCQSRFCLTESENKHLCSLPLLFH